ncbi:MAG: hypothetical protein JWL70_2196, partial [Acidimicrobiia bacterium]|nr:hypothetical protein [Acidimicrobiia bacterium]
MSVRLPERPASSRPAAPTQARLIDLRDRPGPRSATATAARPESGRTPRRMLVAAISALAVLCFGHRPGRLVTDTKVDLPVDPAKFLARTLHLWDTGFFGQIQNQAVGYLFPMGPFFMVGWLADLPPWVVQRLWLLGLVTVAVVGVVRFADQLKISTPQWRVLAGVLYALSPTFLIMWGATSAAIVGGVLMPWIVLPLLKAKPDQHPAGPALRSAFVVGLTGGINATVTIGALGLPIGFLLIGRRGKGRVALCFWWGVGIFMCSLWWAIPLLFQGKYGFNFLPYTERAPLTANAMSATDVLRGSTNWLSYLGIGHPWTQSGWMIAHTPAVVLGTAAVGLLGLVGLTRPTMPHRAWLGATALAALVFMCMGYAGHGGGAAGPIFQALLDGPLSMARNLYKFDPTFRIVLLLGLAHLASELEPIVRRWRPRRRQAAIALTMTIVLAALAPALSGRFLPEGTYADIPAYWREAAAWVTEHQDEGRALLVPTSAFSEYNWGRTKDEPTQPLLDAPWAVRSLVPLGGDGSIRFLDSVEDVLANGRGAPGLPAALANAGVGYLVVRNDLDWRRARTARPSIVRRALFASGLRPVVTFGEVAQFLKSPKEFDDFGVAADESGYPAIEIYGLPKGVSTAKVSTTKLADTLMATGGPDSILAMANRALITGRSVLFPYENPGIDVGSNYPLVVTDSQRRANTQYGLVRDAKSYTLGPDELSAGSVITRQYGFPGPPAEDQATAQQLGLKKLSASSYGSVLLELPELQPSAVIDGDPETSWVADTWIDKLPWIRFDLETPRAVPAIDVTPLSDGPWRALVTTITATTDTGSVTVKVVQEEKPQHIVLPPGTTGSITLSLTISEPFVNAAGAGLREVTIPGVSTIRAIRPPEALHDAYGAGKAAPSPSFIF